ncbi:MAG TPA: AbrB/MazE/SpoVT family DNA-binding domain-containing protein [Gammaproteobacteria bacterium]|nr:AbrB/MazE/SpoVT family DNA-binding domain-containing protein [Gammaproteobacteria bacterium]
MLFSTLTSKGQVTVPIELRQALDLHTGDKIAFEAFDDKILIFKKKDDITQAFGMFHINKKISLKDIQKAIAEGYTDDRS